MRKHKGFYIAIILSMALLLLIIGGQNAEFRKNIESQKMKNNLKGKILFYIDNRSAGRGDYYLMNANGTNIAKFNIINKSCPVLSPQSTKIAWLFQSHSDDFKKITRGMCITDINGKAEQILESKAFDTSDYAPNGKRNTIGHYSGLHWSKDGKEVIFYYFEYSQDGIKMHKQ